MDGENIFQIGDLVIHKRHSVCLIENIEQTDFGNGLQSYFILEPKYGKDRSIIRVPVLNCSQIRNPLKKKQVQEILKNMPTNEDLWITDSKKRKALFISYIDSGDLSKLLSILHTLYIKRNYFAELNKTLPLTDLNIAQTCEKLAFEEIALVLSKDPAAIKDMIYSMYN